MSSHDALALTGASGQRKEGTWEKIEEPWKKMASRGIVIEKGQGVKKKEN